MKKVVLALIILIAVFFSCKNSSGNLDNLKWMIGQWKATDKRAWEYHENWEREDAKNFSAYGFILSDDGDTVYRETLKIESVDGNEYYVYNIPKLKGAVLFKFVEGDEHHVIFENTEHDFPKRISYTLESNNTVDVKLEGVEKNLPKIEEMEYERDMNSPLDDFWKRKKDSAKKKDTAIPTTHINL